MRILDPGGLKGRLVKYSQTLQLQVGEVLLNSMKVKLLIGVKQIGLCKSTGLLGRSCQKIAMKSQLPVWLDNVQATSLLCNVFFVGEQKPNHEKPQSISPADTVNQSAQSVVQKAENHTEQGSTSKRQRDQGNSLQFIAAHKDNETGRIRTRERVPDDLVDIVHETDYLSEGDYLELRDLEIPASPSSSSDSSCLTMSSDECFDVLDLLQDLETEKSKEPVQNNPGCKFSVFASSRPTEVVMYPASTGTLDKSPNEELLTSNRSHPGSILGIKISDKKVLKNPDKKQKPDFRNEGAPSTSQNRVMLPNGNTEAPEEDRQAARGRMKKLKRKYLCFMPF